MHMLSLQHRPQDAFQAPLSRKPQLIFVPPLNSAAVASPVLPHSLRHSTSGIGCCKDMELCQAAPGPAEVPSGARASLTGPLSLISGFHLEAFHMGFPPRSQRFHSQVIFLCNFLSHSCATHLVLGLLAGQDFSWEVKEFN